MLATANGEEAVTVRRYSEITGLSLMTCYRHVQSGKIPAKQFLGRWLVFWPKPQTPPQAEGNV